MLKSEAWERGGAKSSEQTPMLRSSMGERLGRSSSIVNKLIRSFHKHPSSTEDEGGKYLSSTYLMLDTMHIQHTMINYSSLSIMGSKTGGSTII